MSRRVEINDRWPINLPEHRIAQWEGGWEVKRLEAIHDTITPGDVLVDVGAEEGDMGALYALWGADVFLIEPNPYLWPAIRQTFEMNDVEPLAWFVGLIGSDEDLDPPKNDVNAASSDGWPSCAFEEMRPFHGFRHLWEHQENTPRITLDRLCLGWEPDVVTMDIEGAELEALRGAPRLIEEVRPTWFVSVHPSFLKDLYRHTASQVHSVFLEAKYTPILLEDTHEQHWMYVP